MPAITASLRGIMYAQIDVVGGPIDLHSGSYGGVVENPANALATIIAALKGPDGRILVPGFYDDVVALTDADRAALAALPFDEAAYQASLGRAGPRRRGRIHRRWSARARGPTLDVNGIWGGFTGEGTKTIIPAHAHAKISCRLVAGPGPGAHLRALPRLRRGDRPARRHDDGHLPRRRPPEPDPDRPSGDPGRARALEATFGRRAGLHPRGRLASRSSASFETILGLPVVLLGFTPPDDHAHAPNEWMDLDNYETGHPGGRPRLRRAGRGHALTGSGSPPACADMGGPGG